jgi:hypothetical protein
MYLKQTEHAVDLLPDFMVAYLEYTTKAGYPLNIILNVDVISKTEMVELARQWLTLETAGTLESNQALFVRAWQEKLSQQSMEADLTHGELFALCNSLEERFVEEMGEWVADADDYETSQLCATILQGGLEDGDGKKIVRAQLDDELVAMAKLLWKAEEIIAKEKANQKEKAQDEASAGVE